MEWKKQKYIIHTRVKYTIYKHENKPCGKEKYSSIDITKIGVIRGLL
jgi:hypothetical protein